MKPPVQRAYEAFTQIQSIGWSPLKNHIFSREEKIEVRNRQSVSIFELNKALERYRFSENIEAAEDLDDIKEVLNDILDHIML